MAQRILGIEFLGEIFVSGKSECHRATLHAGARTSTHERWIGRSVGRC
jgi:hypothetical protein